MRIFCAVEISDEARAEAVNHIACLREAMANRGLPHGAVRWERADKLHVTMKFFGEVVAERIADLRMATERAASSVREFAVKLEGAGTFPMRGSPRIWWLGLCDAAEELQNLHERLEAECAVHNFKREARKFHPHITIGRTRSAPTDDLAKLTCTHQLLHIEGAEFTVSELVIMQSELSTSGSRYMPLIRCKLAR